MATPPDLSKALENTNSTGLVTDFRSLLKRIPSPFIYTLLLFIVSRIALTAIGIISYSVIGHQNIAQFPDFLKMWDVWDTDQYLNIAQHWYPQTTSLSGMTSYVFSPLYPLLIKLLALVVNDYFISGLIISNVCLFIACFYTHRLVSLDSDEQTARRAVKYLFLFPTAFILSGVLTESLFLALSIACFYYAKKHNWPVAGILGALAAVTRPYGIVILIPMAIEYLLSIDFKIRKIKPDVVALLITPLGLGLYMAYDYFMTGDFFAFVHAQSLWGFSPEDPLSQLVFRLTKLGMDVRFNGIMTLAAIVLLIVYYKKIGVSQLVYGLLLILIPLSSPASMWSMSRYILLVFPLFIIGAKLTKNKRVDQALTIGLAMLQGILMASWTTWGFYVI